jgi:hypothetical protein
MAKIEQTFEIELSAQEYLDGCSPKQLHETLLLLAERFSTVERKSPKKDKPAKKQAKKDNPAKGSKKDKPANMNYQL